MFAHFISEAGYHPKDYPRLSGASVIYTDRKNRPLLEKEVRFPIPIFANNPESFKRFGQFLAKAERDVTVNQIQVKIEDESIILFPNSPEGKTKIFPMNVRA